MEERNDLNHHAAVRPSKATATGGVYDLRDDRPGGHNEYARGPARARNTHETKNMDTPVPPRPAKTPAAGNMIIPSERKEASALANVIAEYVRTGDAVKDIEQRA